jgi:hypothetical protein
MAADGPSHRIPDGIAGADFARGLLASVDSAALNRPPHDMVMNPILKAALMRISVTLGGAHLAGSDRQRRRESGRD